MKTKNGLYNIGFSLLGQVITIIFGLLVPRLLTIGYGPETNALFTTVGTMFSYFTLLEAGIGFTTLQALYKPVAINDKKSINSILSATSRYYKKVALFYLIALVSLSSLFYFFSSETKEIFSYFTIFGVIFFTGIGSVVNFTVQEKFKILLEAEGKKYITINTQTIIFMLTSVTKLIFILMGVNIVLIQISYFAFNLIQVFFIYWYIQKKYKWIDLTVEPNYKAISQKNSVLVHQIASLIFSNTDLIILWIFVDLKVVNIYTMYKMIISMISLLFNNVSSGCTFILGQTFSIDKEKYKKLINSFDVFVQAFGFILFTITYLCILPFMNLYSNGFEGNYIDYKLPILFIAVELLIVMRNASLNTINVAGHFKKTQWRAMFESGINLVVSIVGVIYFGIYGVLLGKLVALLYRDNDIIIYANKVILGRKPTKTYMYALVNLGIFGLFMLISNYVAVPAENFFQLVLSACVISVIVIAAYALVNLTLHRNETKMLVEVVKNKIKKK